MGNNHSAKDHNKVEKPHAEEIKKLFENLCNIGILSREEFEKHFQGPSEVVTKNLFDRFFIDLLNSNISTRDLFLERVHYVLEIADKDQSEQLCFYMDLMSQININLDLKELERIIFECQQFGLILEDGNKDEANNPQNIIEHIVKTCEKMEGDDLRKNFLSWCGEHCPKIFHGLQSWLLFKFTNVFLKGGLEMIPLPNECNENNLQLNGSLLWFFCCILPSCFTKMENKYKVDEDDDHEIDEETKYTWNLLYDSNQHGLSLNRFKHKVMSYKSPTISLLEFSCGLKILLALDEPWIDSPEKFGGPYCMLVEISPTVRIIEADSKMVYLKELGRSIPTGLMIGCDTRAKINISKDLGTAQIHYKHLLDENVERMEVWGCGGVEAIKSQADMKKWESKEIEKRRKVKLPGQWDQDKTILEMGGVRVNHSQRGDI